MTTYKYPDEDHKLIIVLNNQLRKFCPACQSWKPMMYFPRLESSHIDLCIDCSPREAIKVILPSSKKHIRKLRNMYFLKEGDFKAQRYEEDALLSITHSHGGKERMKGFRNSVTSYQGKTCAIMDTHKTQCHHILSVHYYPDYMDNPQNGVMLDVRLHGFVTYIGSYHYVRFFFDLLDEKFHTDHSGWPTPSVEQRNLLLDINQVNLDDFYKGTIA